MGISSLLVRSVLYIPASKPRALDKARGLPVDAIIFDLEDAVAPDEKVAARDTLREALAEGGYDGKLRLIRVNGRDSVWGEDDLASLSGMECDGVLIPKVDGPNEVDAVAAQFPGLPIWCMMETPRGILNALAIADHSAVHGFVIGTNDLAKEIGCATGGDRMPLMQGLQTCVLAARAAGIACVDGVFNAFKDEEGLAAECAQGRTMGMDGKTLIHPAQVDIANRIFAPTEEEQQTAKRQIEAFDRAKAEGQGVAVLDGRIVENLHVETARATLARAERIAKRNAQ